MRKITIILLIVTLQVIIIPLFMQKSYANNLASTMLRLDHLSTGKASGGLICATTPSSDNGLESSLQVIFPNGFTVNQTASNWTVNTSNLLNATTAWPGISTATSVNGQIVTFPSANLLSSTQYCFNFSASNTLITPSVVGNYPGTLRTRNLVNSTIDSKDFGIGIIQNDGIKVTATVPANPYDFGAKLVLTDPSDSRIRENSQLSYKLTYASHLAYPSNIVIEAQWEKGTIRGSGSPNTINTLTYVIGSATKGYSNVQPVIDTLNKKITWTINSLPANAKGTVYFRLSTTNAYKGPKPVDFSVNSRVLGPGTQTPDSTVTSTYQYSAFITPTPYPTCIPSSCPTPTPAPTAIPTPILQAVYPKIYEVEIREINQSSARIEILTDTPTSIRLNYGKSANNLNQSVSIPLSTTHIITMPNLEQNTRYYYKIIATNRNGISFTSDIFTLATSSEVFKALALSNSLIILSNNVVLFDPTKKVSETPTVVIPDATRFSFKIALENYDNIDSVLAIIRNKNVLGINTNETYANTDSLDLTEISPGEYIGSLATSNELGNYGFILRISDYNGNISEQTLSTLNVVKKMRIINSQNEYPIENAKARFYLYNERLRKYEPISQILTPIKSHLYSDTEGVVPIILPEGKYRADILAFGYKSNQVEFEISPSSSNYPTIKLEPRPFSVSTYIEYTLSNAKDAIGLFNEYVGSFKTSTRYLELITLGVILLFIVLALLQISRVFGVGVIILPFFAFYHFIALFHKPQHAGFIQGKVIDISLHTPVEGVLLHFATSNGRIFAHTRSNSNGDFAIAIKKLSTIKITLSKKDYQTFTKKLSSQDITEKLIIAISKSEKPSKFGLSTIIWYLESLIGAFFESFLVLTIIVELIFAQQFGLLKTLPAIIISTGNILIWALHSRPKKAVKSRA